jgi:DNA-binding protein YbaB
MQTEMRSGLGQLVEEYQATRSRLAGLSAEMAATTATARSTDRSVTATVNPQGELVSLAIDPVLGARLDPKALAARVLEASGSAATQVREQLRDTMRGGLPASLRDLVGPDGTIEVQRLLPMNPTDLLHGDRR